MEKVEEFYELAKTWVLVHLPNFLVAVATLLIGWWIIGWVGRITARALSSLDVSLRSFLVHLTVISLKVLLVISVAGMIGFQTTSFIAILGAAGLAIGLALQGTLANFAGGVLILIFKPFKIGDTIETLGKTGIVKEIQIFNTVLLTLKGETVILPNGAVSNGTIVNISAEGRNLAEVMIELDINTDFQLLRTLAAPIFRDDARILGIPAATVDIVELKPGTVTVAFRAYTLPDDVPIVKGVLIEKIKTAIAKYNISYARNYVVNVSA